MENKSTTSKPPMDIVLAFVLFITCIAFAIFLKDDSMSEIIVSMGLLK